MKFVDEIRALTCEAKSQINNEEELKKYLKPRLTRAAMHRKNNITIDKSKDVNHWTFRFWDDIYYYLKKEGFLVSLEYACEEDITFYSVSW